MFVSRTLNIYSEDFRENDISNLLIPNNIVHSKNIVGKILFSNIPALKIVVDHYKIKSNKGCVGFDGALVIFIVLISQSIKMVP